MGQHLFQQIYFISLQKFRSQNLQKRDAQKKFNKHRLVKNGKKIIFCTHFYIIFSLRQQKNFTFHGMMVTV